MSEGEVTKVSKDKQRLLRQTFAHAEDEDFVGMEDDINNLVSFVVDETGPKIISVCGMGGSGKTTMARNVFNHPQVQQVFGAFVWVCITQSCEKISVLQDILKQLTSEDVQSTSFAELVRNIAKVVKEKKGLVVLDDIWNIDDWKIMSRAFVDVNMRSRILITTRNYRVAKVGFIHNQRLLDEEEGLQLLKNKALTTRNEHIGKELTPTSKSNEFKSKIFNVDPLLEKLFGDFGREMIQNCGGLPLAISALGGILRSKFSAKEWMDINKNIGSTLSQGLDGLEDIESTSKVLSLSYQDLPHFLKPCFLYMSAFREDEDIFPRKLYHLWIAEGMVSPGYILAGETLMDVAERFLQELNLRCMVQLKMDWLEGNIISCRLHDLMRDLCLKRAREEDFLERVKIDFQGEHRNMINNFIGHNSHRLAINLNVNEGDTNCVEVLDQLTRQEFIRSFSIHDGSPSWNLKYSVEVLQAATRFKLLRVLDFENFQFHEKKLLDSIGELIHLRYLSLLGCDVDELPLSIGDLPHLQTLDLRLHFGCILMIPHDIFSKKKRLRHLYFNEFSVIAPSTEKLKLDGLSELESLFLYEYISKLDLTSLSRLVNMRNFQYHNMMIKVDNDWPLIMEQTRSWKRIQQFHITMNHGDDGEDIAKMFMSQNITHMFVDGCKLNFRSTYEPLFCQNMVSLEIRYSTIVDDGLMDFVGTFPNLRRFIVGHHNFKDIKFNEMVFSQLKHLKLNCNKLMVREGSLPNLITLQLGYCQDIVPENGLQYLRNLKELILVKGEYVSRLKDKCLRHHLQYPHISIKEVDF